MYQVNVASCDFIHLSCGKIGNSCFIKAEFLTVHSINTDKTGICNQEYLQKAPGAFKIGGSGQGYQGKDCLNEAGFERQSSVR